MILTCDFKHRCALVQNRDGELARGRPPTSPRRDGGGHARCQSACSDAWLHGACGPPHDGHRRANFGGPAGLLGQPPLYSSIRRRACRRNGHDRTMRVVVALVFAGRYSELLQQGFPARAVCCRGRAVSGCSYCTASPQDHGGNNANGLRSWIAPSCVVPLGPRLGSRQGSRC